MRPVTVAELEQLLAFPRAYLRSRLPTLKDCPHANNYDQHDETCRTCFHRDDCAWLAANDECGVLDLTSVDQVTRAIDDMCVRAQSAVSAYRHRACHCPTCEWLRQAKKVMKRVKAGGIASPAARRQELDVAPA